MATEDSGPKTAAAPLFTHDELLTGFRQLVQDAQKYYALRIEQKHADYPESICKHRMQCGITVGQFLKHSGPVLSDAPLIKQHLDLLLAIIKPTEAAPE